MSRQAVDCRGCRSYGRPAATLGKLASKTRPPSHRPPTGALENAPQTPRFPQVPTTSTTTRSNLVSKKVGEVQEAGTACPTKRCRRQAQPALQRGVGGKHSLPYKTGAAARDSFEIGLRISRIILTFMMFPLTIFSCLITDATAFPVGPTSSQSLQKDVDPSYGEEGSVSYARRSINALTDFPL